MKKCCKMIEKHNDHRKGVASMGRRMNERFLMNYLEVEKYCCDKFGVTTGGITEYINRLNNARFAPGRDDVLPRLVRYRNLRNKFAHEVGALRRADDVAKGDITWLRAFHRDLKKKRDPISVYLKKARRFVRRRKFRRLAYAAATVVIVGLIVALYFALKH